MVLLYVTHADQYVQVLSFPTACDRALAMIQLRGERVTLRIQH